MPGKRITKWYDPNTKVTAAWMECPECHTIDDLLHTPSCSKPPKESLRCDTTEFGKSCYRCWLENMKVLLGQRGQRTTIVRLAETKESVPGDVDAIALFEV